MAITDAAVAIASIIGMIVFFVLFVGIMSGK